MNGFRDKVHIFKGINYTTRAHKFLNHVIFTMFTAAWHTQSKHQTQNNANWFKMLTFALYDISINMSGIGLVFCEHSFKCFGEKKHFAS